MMMKSLLVLLAFVSAVSAHGRLVSPRTRDMLAGRQTHEMNAPVAKDNNFICRGLPKGANQAVLNAGGSFNFQWSFSAAHVGDCSAYLSYDGGARWFKIWDMFECKDANNRDVQVNLPSFLPRCDNCILRWEWVALHQGGNNPEFYAQCVDVQINGNGQSLPATFTMPDHLPASGYRNAFGSGDRRITGPAIATGPGGGQVPPPTPGTPPPPTPPPTDGSCYNRPELAKNLNGPISGQCAGGARCANGQCCSEFGYCGTTGDYCNARSQGDWTTKACSVPTGGQCYKSGPGLNLNGAINANSACGQNAPGSRCATGNCCSQYGYCGTSAEHCNANQGDWRTVSCSGANNITPRDDIFNNSTDPVDTNGDLLGGSASKLAAAGLLAALAAL
eukprot:TRINITY_DN472_c0_g1_i2.p1 TRINITY_DN472_c0_g1~~TRINITY_DN472_c0_g1_i2.p1  ORF type:complete len:390 (-),score=121.00 TRINITY_DN472_c0_g1_i2:68-1237(-)